MPSRLIAWLDAQPKGRRRLYSGLIALSLLTLPCYAAGLALRLLDVGPPPPPTVSLATAEATVTASATIGLKLLPTVAPPPTWTPGFDPDLPEEPAATLDPSLPTVDPALASATPEAGGPVATPSETAPLPASPTPPEATAEPATAEPATPEPATSEPTAPPEPTGPPPTAIGGFTPQPAGRGAEPSAGGTR